MTIKNETQSKEHVPFQDRVEKGPIQEITIKPSNAHQLAPLKPVPDAVKAEKQAGHDARLGALKDRVVSLNSRIKLMDQQRIYQALADYQRLLPDSGPHKETQRDVGVKTAKFANARISQNINKVRLKPHNTEATDKKRTKTVNPARSPPKQIAKDKAERRAQPFQGPSSTNLRRYQPNLPYVSARTASFIYQPSTLNAVRSASFSHRLVPVSSGQQAAPKPGHQLFQAFSDTSDKFASAIQLHRAGLR